jgi:polysaccharide export outer membrane protein
MIYLGTREFSTQSATQIENNKTAYRLQPSDILSVQIKSTTAEELSGVFNVASELHSMFANPGNFYMEGYSIDASGKISLPVIGQLEVGGMTVDEAQKLIQLNVNRYLRDATVVVRMTSFKVTVLGNVKNPGYYYVYNNRANVLEALGMAGDLTEFGNREKVKLIRQNADGSEVTLLDLTDSRLPESEYYFLMPGDVLYVEPLKARVKRTNLELLSVVFSAATTAILILNYAENN